MTDPAVISLMEEIRGQVETGWRSPGPIDLRAPRARRYLSDHRLWSLIAMEAVGSSLRPELRNRQLAVTASLLRIRSTAAEVLALLGAEGIESRVLKGLATAELDYPDPLRRHTGDVDLAVRPEQLDPAVRVLRSQGYRDHHEPFSPHLRYGWTLRSPSDVEIDLHTRLSRRSPLGDHLFRGPGEPLPGLGGHALAAPHRLVHAAGHFMIAPPGSRRLSGLLDVTRLHHHPDLDLEEARRFAGLLGIESLVGAGLRMEAMLSGRPNVIDHLDTWRQPDWLERKTRLVPERRLLLDHLGRYREVPPGQRLKYLPAWLVPSRRQRRLLTAAARRNTLRLVKGPR